MKPLRVGLNTTVWLKSIRIIDDQGVTFSYKDYKDNARQNVMTLPDIEFSLRFCLHILPYRFVKIRYYGILSSKQKETVKPLLVRKSAEIKEESKRERIFRITGFDPFRCPFCKEGVMYTIEMLPKIRSPTNVLYPGRVILYTSHLLCRMDNEMGQIR